MTDLSSPAAVTPLAPASLVSAAPAGERAPAPAPAPAPVGLVCPLCGRALDRVLFTRKVAGSVRRVRKCDPCGRRWQTAETIVAGVPAARPR